MGIEERATSGLKFKLRHYHVVLDWMGFHEPRYWLRCAACGMERTVGMAAGELIAELQKLAADAEVVIGYESVVRVPDNFEATRGFRFRWPKGGVERIELDDPKDPTSLERRHAAWIADGQSVDPIRAMFILEET